MLPLDRQKPEYIIILNGISVLIQLLLMLILIIVSEANYKKQDVDLE